MLFRSKASKVVATVAAKGSKVVAGLSNVVIEIEDNVVEGSARFWQRQLKGSRSHLCLRTQGTRSNPIDLMDIDSEVDDEVKAIL